MIAIGTRVLFTDRLNTGTHMEPHNGMVGIATDCLATDCTVTFPDGSEIWADMDEVTAL